MNLTWNPRLVRRFRRPATRAQIRQRINQLHVHYEAEAALDRLHDAFMSDALCSLEEQI